MKKELDNACYMLANLVTAPSERQHVAMGVNPWENVLSNIKQETLHVFKPTTKKDAKKNGNVVS